MINLNDFVVQIVTNPEDTEFQEVLETINRYYSYIPTSFNNGSGDEEVINAAGENEGSCKVFSFAQLHQLDEIQTLNCFGKYYREDVLKHQTGTDHANIRAFIRHGWQGIKFENDALKLKT